MFKILSTAAVAAMLAGFGLAGSAAAGPAPAPGLEQKAQDISAARKHRAHPRRVVRHRRVIVRPYYTPYSPYYGAYYGFDPHYGYRPHWRHRYYRPYYYRPYYGAGPFWPFGWGHRW